MTTTDPWSDWGDPPPPPPRPPNPQQITCWLSRHVVGYTANETPIYEGRAMTEAHQEVHARSVGATVEIIPDA